ncbi:MAG TPA: pseudouridine synthase [Abditibacterium sp.]|jgi:23S rRNA pseudouridine2605 synthase
MSDAALIPPSVPPISAPDPETTPDAPADAATTPGNGKNSSSDDKNLVSEDKHALGDHKNAVNDHKDAFFEDKNALSDDKDAVFEDKEAFFDDKDAFGEDKNSVGDEPGGELERVSKLIMRAGIASRRAAEDMIVAGRVTVNGHTIAEPGTKADPLNDRIIVDGHPLRVSEKPGVVLVFHKPRLVMTTKDDPGGRPTVMDYLPRKWQSLHPVGRLDFDTSGVLLLTDDGELTHLLTHPSHGAEKVYEARVRGVVEPAAIEKLERGIRLDDGPTAPCRAKLMAQRDKNALVQLVLREGRNRQVRRMLEAVGHPANALRRISFAGIELEGLPAGEFRVLLPGEVKALRKRVESKVKKLSAPKGKFHKQKIKRDDEKPAPNSAETESRSSRPAPRGAKISVPVAKYTLRVPKPSTGTKKVANRPRNAPNLPEKAPLERKGSKARPYTRKGDGQTDAARSAAPRSSAPRSGAPRDSAPRNPTPRNPAPRTSAPRNEAPRGSAPRSPRNEATEQAPVSRRVQKRWKD